MEEPEIIKMLKYILLVVCLVLPGHCHPLVAEQIVTTTEKSLPQPETVTPLPPPKTNSGNVEKSSISGDDSQILLTISENGGPVVMSPVPHISEIQEDLAPNTTGGQKHVRQVHDTTSGSPSPPNNELCSIFQFFLEPRRYSRCRVSNTYSESERDNEAEYYNRAVSNEVVPSDSSASDNFHSGSETREIERDGQGPLLQPHPPRADIGNERGNRNDGEQSASKRYDQLEEISIHGPPDEPHHLGGPHPPSGPPPMFPKSSLDRTTIIVPERPCPRGERRDHKGFCRRIVRVRPSYQYGPPPPPPYGPSRPIRYYYSRFVSVPTLQFFIPSVP